MKTCRDCQQEKPLSDYPRSGTSHRSQCKPCYNVWQRAYWERRSQQPRTAPDLKPCRTCGIEKPAADFHKSGTKGSGLRPSCKACMHRKGRQAQIDHPERFRLHYAMFDEALGMLVKVCIGCGIKKTQDDFYPLAGGRIRSRCKACEALAGSEQYTRQHGRKRDYAPRPGMTDEERKSAQRRHNRRRLAAQLAYNKARVARLTPDERARHDAMTREVRRRYAKLNPDVHRAKEKRRRARKSGAAIVEIIDRAAIIVRDASACYLCLLVLTDDEITLDHVIPLVRGGVHTADNLRVACRPCNSRKGRRLLSELDLGQFRTAS